MKLRHKMVVNLTLYLCVVAFTTAQSFGRSMRPYDVIVLPEAASAAPIN